MPDLSIVSPEITSYYGVPLQVKRRAISIAQSQDPTIEFQFLDNKGNPVDLTPYCDPEAGCVELRIREAISTKGDDIFVVDADITDAENGIVETTIPAKVGHNPGVYMAEFGVFKQSADPPDICPGDVPLVFTNKIYLWVDRGLFGCPEFPQGGPPNIDDIKLFLRDNAPEENLLLEDFEFDLADLCIATALSVRYWNEAQPPVASGFTTITYPTSLYWTQAIAGYMFLMAANRYRRNRLPYQAGGLAVNDQDREQQYLTAGLQLIKDYREWVKMKKVQINCEMAITSAGSGYGLYYFFNN